MMVTAVHEAGHAAVALYHNLEVTLVTMDPPRTFYGPRDNKLRPDTVIKWGSTMLAGMVAEVMYEKNVPESVEASETDIQVIRNHPLMRENSDEIFRVTWNLVEVLNPVIMELSRSLNEKGFLYGKDCERTYMRMVRGGTRSRKEKVPPAMRV